MKSLFKKFIKFIFIFITIIAMICVALGIVLIDTTKIGNEKIICDNKNSITIINNNLQKATDNTINDKIINYLLDEEQLEYLLYSIVKEIDLSTDKFSITGVDIDVINEEYTLKLAIESLNIPSVIYTTLDFKEDNGNFTISCDSLKLSKLNLHSIGKFILSYIDEVEIEERLANSNIYCDINLKETSVLFTKDNIIKMLTSNIKDSSSNLITLIADIFINNDNLLKFNLGKDDLFGIILHLNNLVYDENIKGILPYNYDFDKVINDVSSLLDNSVITTDEVNLVFKYLINGYNCLPDEEKIIIDNIDLTSINIVNKELYISVIDRTPESLEITLNSLLSEIDMTSLLLDNKLNILLSDDILTSTLKNTELVGFSYAFAHDETNEGGYIIIEQFNISCLKDIVYFDFIINFNGLQCYIEIKLDCPSNNGLSIKGTLNSASIGNQNLNDNQKVRLLSYIKSAVNDLNWIEIDCQNNVVTLDFVDLISSNDIMNSILSNYANSKISTSIIDGHISINYSFN